MQVASLTRELITLTADPKVGTSGYRVVAPALQYECAVQTML